MINEGKIDVWCCEPTTYGELCSYPATIVVIYGNNPDETTVMCEGHIRETWQPTWETRGMTERERDSWKMSWEDWVAQGKVNGS